MLTTASRRVLLPVVTCALLVGSARAQTDGASGESVSEDAIEQRTKLDFLSTHKQAARQDVINELAEERAKIKQAKEAGIDPTSADVESTFAEMCSRMRTTPEQLTRALEAQGIRPETLKQRIRADIDRIGLIRLRRDKF